MFFAKKTHLIFANVKQICRKKFHWREWHCLRKKKSPFCRECHEFLSLHTQPDHVHCILNLSTPKKNHGATMCVRKNFNNYSPVCGRVVKMLIPLHDYYTLNILTNAAKVTIWVVNRRAIIAHCEHLPDNPQGILQPLSDHF